MSKLVKIFAVLVLILAVVAVAGLFILKSWLTDQLTPDGLVRHIESSLNCRAEIGGVKGEVAGTGDSTLVITDLVLAPRDASADNAMPLAERRAIPQNLRTLSAKKVSVDLAGGDLVGGKLNIRSLVVDGLELLVDYYPEGGNSLVPLFTSPSEGGETVGANPLTLVPKEVAAEGEDGTIYASDIPLPSTLGRLAIEGGGATLRHLKTGSQTRLDDLNIELTDIQVDAKNLVGHNHVGLQFDTKVILEALEGGDDVVEILLAGDGDLIPFDLDTGALDLSGSAEVRLLAGSRFDGLPIVARLGSAVQQAAEIGIDLAEFDAEKVLAEDTSAGVEYESGKLTVVDDLGLSMKGYQVGFSEGAWFDFDADVHEVRGSVVASQELSDKAKGEAEEFVREKVGDLLAIAAQALVIEPLMNDDGRFSLDFKSTGEIGDPDVGLDLPDIGSLLGGLIGGGDGDGEGEEGGSGLGGLLRGILGE